MSDNTEYKFPTETIDLPSGGFTENGNKAAGGRARKAVGEVKKLVTDYRKASVTESKS